MVIAEQIKLLAEIIADRKSYEKPIAAFKGAYEKLELGSFTDSVLTEVSKSGIEGVVYNYLEGVSSEIEASGIKNSRMKAVLMQSCDQLVDEFRLVYNALLDSVAELRKKKADESILATTLVVKGFGLEKHYAFSTNPKNLFKQLTIGRNSWVAVEGGKSWGLEWCEVRWRPDNGEVYLYAKCPKDMEPGKLEVHYKIMPNTPNEYMILLRSGSYDDVSF